MAQRIKALKEARAILEAPERPRLMRVELRLSFKSDIPPKNWPQVIENRIADSLKYLDGLELVETAIGYAEGWSE